MMPTITARELMVSNLITLKPKMDVLDALDVLLRHRISGAPVVDDDGKFLGSFSEKSCMRFVVSAAYDGLPRNTVVSFIDANPPTIDEETDILTIAQTFLDGACRRLPVLDNQGRLRGQISRRDVMGAIRDHLRTPEQVVSGSGLYISALMDSDERPIK